jgi:hypothetical protein
MVLNALIDWLTQMLIAMRTRRTVAEATSDGAPGSPAIA